MNWAAIAVVASIIGTGGAGIIFGAKIVFRLGAILQEIKEMRENHAEVKKETEEQSRQLNRIAAKVAHIEGRLNGRGSELTSN